MVSLPLPSFAELLEQYRLAKGLTQEVLALEAGLNPATVNDLETGDTKGPRKDTVKKLVKRLDLNPQQTKAFEQAAERGRPRPRRKAPEANQDSGARRVRELITPPKVGGKGAEQEVVTRLTKRVQPGAESADERGERSRSLADALGFRSAEALRRAIVPSVKLGVEAINKYTRHLYVARQGIEAEFARFQASPERPCFLLQGEAGVGKSNQFCEMAQTTSARFPALLIRGTTHVTGRWGLWEYVAAELHAKGAHRVHATKIVEALHAFLDQQKSQLFIFIDGINENTQVELLKGSLASAVADAAGTRIKICLSCRDVDWRLFAGEALLTHRLHRPRASGGQATEGVVMDYFTDEELREAWPKYARYYALHVPRDVPPGLAAICRHPLMLQFLSEAFRGKAVPEGIHRKEIFDRYWDAKLGSRPKVEAALYRVAEAMYDARTTELPRLDVIDLIGEDSFDDILSENVILYVDPADRDRMVTFKYDAFHEYAIAMFLRRRWRWSARDADVAANLHALLAVADSYRPKQGILLYLLLSLGASPVVRDFLRHLAGQDDARWRIFVCDFVTKLADLDLVAELVPLLTDLSRDDRFPVRWAAANALGIVAQTTCPDAARTLDAMAASREWMEREAAALAATHFSRDFLVAAAMLERLADDINWRVRRAVGSSLNHLCRTAQEETFELLWRWTEQDDRWRLRRAVAQAKYGLLRDPTAANTMLGTLAADTVAEIRWRAVSDLVALMDVPDYGASSFALLLHIVNNATDDDEIFVRRHVAFWLPEICRHAGDRCRVLLERLVADNAPFVRWEAARALSFVADEALAAEYLDQLKEDENGDVRFAAQYSRAALGRSDRALDDPLASQETDVRLRALRERLARSSRDMKTLDARNENAADIFSTWKHDRYGIIREVLTEGTSAISPEQLRDFFELLCHDEDEGIRWAVAGNLAEARGLEPEAVIALLLGLIGDKHYWTRRESAASLGKLTKNESNPLAPTPEVVRAVVAASKDENAEVRFAALGCLVALRDSKGLQDVAAVEAAIAARREDEDRQVREYAESVLVRVN